VDKVHDVIQVIPNTAQNPSKALCWGQALLSCFDFEIEHIQGIKNSLPDFLTREFLQGKHE
jgi:hypothetical protein